MKDASSTSIYGARAANGVILVTTKRGKQGKVNINFKANASFQTMANPYDMMDAKEYMQMSNDFLLKIGSIIIRFIHMAMLILIR